MSRDDFEKLVRENQEKLRRQFEASGEIDSFFLNLLENFSFRYIEDEKCEKTQITKQNDSSFMAMAKTYSLKKGLELSSGEEKNNLIAKLKENVGNKRATALQVISIDIANLSREGEGDIRTQLIYNWNFPEHTLGGQEIKTQHRFNSQDWVSLRKEYPLILDELCQFFI